MCREGGAAIQEEHRFCVVNVLAHVNHGKTTFMDNILAHEGALTRSMSGLARLLDSRKDELERGITMKLSPVSMHYRDLHLSFLDTPGHLEFNSLAISTCPISDISVVVIDGVKGVTQRALSLVRGALERKAEIVLFVNKVDALFRLGVGEDELVHRLETIAAKINHVLRMHGNREVEWERENLVVGSAKENYAVSCSSVREGRHAELMSRLRENWTLEKALKFLLKISAVGDSQEKCAEMGEKLGLRNKRPSRKELLSTLIPLDDAVLRALYKIHADQEQKAWGKHTRGIVGFSVLAEGEVVSVAKVVSGSVRRGELCILYEDSAFRISVVSKVVEFRSTGVAEVEEARGLVGMVGIDLQKRGVLVRNDVLTQEEASLLMEQMESGGGAAREEIERALLLKADLVQEMDSVEWPEFRPVYTDVIVPEKEQREEVARKLSRALRCEPLVRGSVSPSGEITIRSDGALQIEKLLADLHGHAYKVYEKSLRFRETLRDRSRVGVFSVGGEEYSARICPLPQGEVPETEEGCERLCRGCFMRYEGDPEQREAIAREICIFLKTGPYLGGEVDLLLFEVSWRGRAEDERAGVRKALAKIYLDARPQVISNHIILDVGFPKTYIKAVSSAVQQGHGSIVETCNEDEFCVKVKVVLGESRALVDRIRTATKGEADISVGSEEFFEPVKDPGLEKELAEKIRQERGLLRKEQLVSEPSKQRTLKH